jgi:hypothetical protein
MNWIKVNAIGIREKDESTFYTKETFEVQINLDKVCFILNNTIYLDNCIVDLDRENGSNIGLEKVLSEYRRKLTDGII